MAHIKIKPLLQFSSAGYDSVMAQTSHDVNNTEVLQKIKKDASGFTALTKWNETTLATGFPYTHKGETKMFIEPNPVVSFYATAHQFTMSSIRLRDDLLKDADIFNLHGGENLKRTSGFVSTASVAIVFMFTSIETLLNIIIEGHKGDFIIKSEVIPKEKILWWSPEDKIKKVLLNINPKCFHVVEGKKYFQITKLLAMRNSIMHFKIDNDSTMIANRTFIENLLKFEYNKTLDATKDFINFYMTDLIENCDCGKD